MASRILFLLPYPLHRAPSQRFRVEAYFALLEKEGIPYDTDVFIGEAAAKILYQKGAVVQKALAVLKGFLKRTYTVLFKSHRYDYVFVHREAAPLGPPLFEWVLAKLFRKRLVFDFDDAIWIPNVTKGNGVARLVKCFWKVKYICKWSHKVSAGNDYLAAYAGRYNANVVVVPTCVDTEKKFNRLKNQEAAVPVVGWTGSHSTLKYLNAVEPVLRRLAKGHRFHFLVICDRPPLFTLPNLRFLPWKEASEIDDLLQLNIGLMPLEQDAWSEGKCGFKIIQYLSLGIPAVASPVGVNKQLVVEGETGYPAVTEEEWYTALAALLTNEADRTRMGLNGHQRVKDRYSVRANAANFLSLFS